MLGEAAGRDMGVEGVDAGTLVAAAAVFGRGALGGAAAGAEYLALLAMEVLVVRIAKHEPRGRP
jgi:hypothetical protein